MDDHIRDVLDSNTNTISNDNISSLSVDRLLSLAIMSSWLAEPNVHATSEDGPQWSISYNSMPKRT
ncbi:hypothetical protein A2U01_0064008 [Trifolium medium]|uniref:Uncharacterized protein n=1 Tax=Trifolium medium TaxID=97028 RepID=A0A392S1M0_9FABA|nr:hypothetical protein [Trifolium medium]